MDYLLSGFIGALKLLFSFDREIQEIIWLSLFVSSLSTIFAFILSIPSGILIGLKTFKGRNILIKIINTLMGFPPVLAGLLVYITVSRRGPLGSLGILFTPAAMIIAQTLLVFPIICGMIINYVETKGVRVYETLYALGANRFDMAKYIVIELKKEITSSVVAGFGRAISEVGAVMLVGGNIQHKTRVMTTYLVLQTNIGNYQGAIAIGLVLLTISFLVNTILNRISRK
ncbi:ABC transporter permease [Fervidicella metallireducens AeB]|uniref:ABC transporter permease n=1 Tax=Fervidicella metallireducens AeB TaxID=1403537 RepID=A0A017RTY0_9CLOT|nr:ABC transporter permease [Fervidicella metallireducens]EYE88223.1 ABC transporter permease [Fervidicella metallireducens AeB]